MSNEHELRIYLQDLHQTGMSWREIATFVYQNQISFATLADIAERGYIPKQVTTRQILGLDPLIEISGQAITIKPTHRVITCAYRHCQKKELARAPNHKYCSPAHGRAERAELERERLAKLDKKRADYLAPELRDKLAAQSHYLTKVMDKLNPLPSQDAPQGPQALQEQRNAKEA